MSYLKKARASPEVTASGEFAWYHGDQFSWVLSMSLTDQSGYPVELTTGNSVVVLSVMEHDEEIYHKEFTEFNSQDGRQTITWAIGADETDLFQPGKYRLKMIVHHGLNAVPTITTIVDSNITIRR